MTRYNTADIVFTHCKSSLLRQDTVHASFFSIHEYTSAALGRVPANYVALLWVADGQPYCRRLVVIIRHEKLDYLSPASSKVKVRKSCSPPAILDG